jgi:hypothetical protein
MRLGHQEARRLIAMKSTIAALVAALVSGTAMYAVGSRTSAGNDMVSLPGIVQPVSAPSYTDTRTAWRPANVAVTQPAPRRVVTTAPRVSETKPQRSWGKTALIIGGSAASGAGVGAAIGGKKGAITGAAIGGGAASIYEAIRRQ